MTANLKLLKARQNKCKAGNDECILCVLKCVCMTAHVGDFTIILVSVFVPSMLYGSVFQVVGEEL